MSSPAPIQNAVVDGNGKATKPWIIYFQELSDGDAGNKWSPVANNLGASGTPKLTGNYYQNEGWTDFWIKIVPGTNTSSTAGTTYFTLPFDVQVDGPCFVVSDQAAVIQSIGAINAASNRCYPPAWTNNTGNLTISGRAYTG